MGGTFDPIHIGHLACAEQARQAYSLNAVVFVPAGVPVFKKNAEVTSAQDRYAMCMLAVESNAAFDVSPMEIERGGDTYTVDTLRELRAHYPENVELFFITGADAVRDIVRWKDSAQVARLARFIAVTRPGYELDEVRRDLDEASERFSIDYLEVTSLAVSSSDLRTRLRAGKSIRYLVMDVVRRYICDQELYCASAAAADALFDAEKEGHMEADEDALSDEFFEARERDLRERVGKRRLEHIHGVASTAKKLAKVYGVDKRRARLAGLLHDWDKAYDDDGIRARAAELGMEVDPFVLEHMPCVLHANTAARALARDFPQIPADVLQAIDRHTVCARDMTPLDMVVYIADALEPGRTFGPLDELRAEVGKVELGRLYADVYRYWVVLLLERTKMLHPSTIDIWNDIAIKYQQGKDERK